jgi:prevent-host-death family protein
MDDIVRKRLKILNHWHKFGLASTVDAFGVSKSTLYAWRKSLRQAGGNTVALKPVSKRPKRVRAPAWCPQIMAELKRLRQSIPNLGKEKVFAKLVAFCQQHGLVLPSVSTIGRMIASAPDKLRTSAWQTNSRGQRKRFTRAAVTRKPKGVQLQPLECLAFDTVIRQREGIKRYILTAIDPKTHIAFAYAPPTGNSAHAAKLHEAITHTFPDYAKAKALTDNGSEFKGHFAKRMTDHEVMHWKTYPKTPKMNAHCERFNRSIQESFVDYNEDLLFTDLVLFNQKMSDWLVFYNTELPHLSTKPNPKKTTSLTNLPVSPIEFLWKSRPQSRIYWTNSTLLRTIKERRKPMATLTASEARAGFYRLIDQTAESHKPVVISGKRGNAVLISEEDWSSIQETLYLLAIPNMRESIKDAMAQPLSKSKKALKW